MVVGHCVELEVHHPHLMQILGLRTMHVAVGGRSRFCFVEVDSWRPPPPRAGTTVRDPPYSLSKRYIACRPQRMYKDAISLSRLHSLTTQDRDLDAVVLGAVVLAYQTKGEPE